MVLLDQQDFFVYLWLINQGQLRKEITLSLLFQSDILKPNSVKRSVIMMKRYQTSTIQVEQLPPQIVFTPHLLTQKSLSPGNCTWNTLIRWWREQTPHSHFLLIICFALHGFNIWEFSHGNAVINVHVFSVKVQYRFLTCSEGAGSKCIKEYKYNNYNQSPQQGFQALRGKVK